MYYTNHNMMILDKYKIGRDYLSKEVIVRGIDYSLIRCKSYKLFINAEEYNFEEGGSYAVPRNQNLNFTIEKYTLVNSKIDTVRVTRELCL